MPSWRDSIEVSALGGLAALEDKRALDLAFRLAGKGNRPQVRAAALRLLGPIGKDDPRVFTFLSETMTRAVDKADFSLAGAAAEALAALADPRGLAVFESVRKKAEGTSLAAVLMKSDERLRLRTMGPARPQSRP
jgi:uncharacterized caspase-like protein